jgi:hypothetical protein
MMHTHSRPLGSRHIRSVRLLVILHEKNLPVLKERLFRLSAELQKVLPYGLPQAVCQENAGTSTAASYSCVSGGLALRHGSSCNRSALDSLIQGSAAFAAMPEPGMLGTGLPFFIAPSTLPRAG